MNGPRRPVRPFTGLLTPEALAPGTEFTDRDNPQFPPSRQTTDYAGEGTLAAQLPKTPLGEPATDVDVRSVYDARPIQGFDFNFLINSSSFTIGDGGGTALVSTRTQVPHGYVAVVRRLHHSFIPDAGAPLPPVTYRSQVLATMIYQNAAVLFNQNVPVGLESDDIFHTFWVADEDTEIGVDYLVTLGASAATTTAAIATVMYGNLIRKTGRPAPQEIGNPIATRGRQRA